MKASFLLNARRTGLAALSTAFLLSGCGADSSPVASSEEQVVRLEEEGFRLFVGVEGVPAAKKADRSAFKAQRQAEREAKKAQREAKTAQREAKKAQREAEREAKQRTDSKVIGPEGGALSIRYRGESGGHDDIQVHFQVPEGALDREETISMILQGESLETLVIVFEPAGLTFKVPARLMIKVGRDMAGGEADDGKGYHIYEDESGEEVEDEVEVESEGGRKTVSFLMQVPGFSRYSLGGGS